MFSITQSKGNYSFGVYEDYESLNILRIIEETRWFKIIAIDLN
jgi:hypothetical protein